MDLQSFIQSGLLESYVLGQVTAEERSLVERMLSQHTEAQTELSSIEQVIERYAVTQAISPPAWMKGRILDQLDQLPTPTTVPVAQEVIRPVAAIGTLRVFQLLSAALLVAVAFLWYKNSEVQTRQTEQQTQFATVQNRLNDCAQRAERSQQIVNLIRDADTKVIKLTNGADGKGTALLYKNDVRNATVLDLSGVMAPSAPDKFLQFWAVVDGKPISLGMVLMEAPDGWHPFEHNEKVDYFAISEENNPKGNLTPTTIVMKSEPDNG